MACSPSVDFGVARVECRAQDLKVIIYQNPFYLNLLRPVLMVRLQVAYALLLYRLAHKPP
jgi:hypothetical protein